MRKDGLLWMMYACRTAGSMGGALWCVYTRALVQPGAGTRAAQPTPKTLSMGVEQLTGRNKHLETIWILGRALGMRRGAAQGVM